MDEDIRNFMDDMGLTTEPVDLDHDTICVIQAGQLLDLGVLEYEVGAYGTAYREGDSVKYFITSREESMVKFKKKACLDGIYFTPAKYYCKRYDLINETEEEAREMFRKDVACNLYAEYPDCFFEAIRDLTNAPAGNMAFPAMQKLMNLLENRFDENHLVILQDLAELLLHGHMINREAYTIIRNWIREEQEKAISEPIHYGPYKRTLAGFVYEKSDGKRELFADAVPYIAEEKQKAFLEKGYLVSPILTVTYFADTFMEARAMRDDIEKTMVHYLTDIYLPFMKYLKTLPGGVDADAYHKWEAVIAESGKTEAISTFRYYGYLWNVL